MNLRNLIASRVQRFPQVFRQRGLARKTTNNSPRRSFRGARPSKRETLASRDALTGSAVKKHPPLSGPAMKSGEAVELNSGDSQLVFVMFALKRPRCGGGTQRCNEAGKSLVSRSNDSHSAQLAMMFVTKL